jgi:hypothetical protein
LKARERAPAEKVLQIVSQKIAIACATASREKIGCATKSFWICFCRQRFARTRETLPT